jgi:hypothetical protein
MPFDLEHDKRLLAAAAKGRHPMTMMRQSSVWEYVDRSSIVVEKARQGRYVKVVFNNFSF